MKDLLLLTSPPASGKTYWIKSFKETQKSKRILVVSPLRALANECKENWETEISVMTPEEWMKKKESFDIVIFDEFHLNFYWGDSFRPLMWEMFYEVVENPELVVLLTATLTSEMRAEIEHFSTHFDRMLWADQGNQQLKNLPQIYLRAPSKNWLIDVIFNEPKTNSVRLIFCEFKDEVRSLAKMLNEKGYSTISCIGGESDQMASRLKDCPRPDFIISTTVLSHGVNLPSIQKIYFLYPTKNIDFWIQMVARGGRRGESYEVYSLEKPFLLPWNPIKNYFGLLRVKISQFEFPFIV